MPTQPDLDFIPSDDPSEIIAPPLGAFSGDASDVSLESLLNEQIKIAGELQRIITEQGKSMDTKDLRDLVSTTNTLVSSIHRTGESLRALATYRAFTDVILEFIRTRTDQFGDDLLDDLTRVARELRAESSVREVMSSRHG